MDVQFPYKLVEQEDVFGLLRDGIIPEEENASRLEVVIVRYFQNYAILYDVVARKVHHALIAKIASDE